MSFFIALTAALVQPAPAPASPHAGHGNHAAPAPAAPAAPATVATPAAQRYSVNTTRIADLMANAATKAIVDRHIPGFSADPRVAAAAGMTLKAVQGYSNGAITEAHLEAIERDLAALPAS